MGGRSARAMAVVAGLWAGVLLAIALIGAPAGFAVLSERADAGRVAGQMFVREGACTTSSTASTACTVRASTRRGSAWSWD